MRVGIAVLLHTVTAEHQVIRLASSCRTLAERDRAAYAWAQARAQLAGSLTWAALHHEAAQALGLLDPATAGEASIEPTPQPPHADTNPTPANRSTPKKPYR